MEPQPQPAYKQKINKHVTNIRRDSRQRTIQNRRNKIYFQTQPIQKIAQAFRLPSKQYSSYTILQIINLCYNELMSVTDRICKMSEDQTGVPVKDHVKFWAYFFQEIFTEKLQINQGIQTFLLHFITKNPYKILAEDPALQLKVINTLQIVTASDKACPQLKKQILRWVRGTDSLQLISNSLGIQFLSPSEYPNIYEILKQSLKMTSMEKLNECTTVIKQLLKTADYDDTLMVYTEQSDLMSGLLTTIFGLVDDQDIPHLAQPVIYLMDSYNSMIFDYARMGVGLLATRMVVSRRPPNVQKGLEIIKFLSQVDDKKCIHFLVEDRQLNEAGLWKTIIGSGYILFNQNISIKRQGYVILSNIMSNGAYEDIKILNRQVKLSNFYNIFDLVLYAMRNEDDHLILKCVLIILSILLYYSYNYKDEREENVILSQIVFNNLEKDLQILERNRNTDVAESAAKILHNISCIRNSEQEQEI